MPVMTAAARSTLADASDPDIVIMMRVKRDDVDAFSLLVDRYRPAVFGRFFRQFGDRQEAEDLAQEVFLRLFRSRRAYQPRAKFATWVFHVAANVGRNAVRRRRRKPWTAIGQLSGEADEAFAQHYLPDHGEEPSRPLERAELAEGVRRAVAGLPARPRAALELQFEDRSYREIATRLAMTPKAAKSLLYRARLQLRESLAPLASQ